MAASIYPSWEHWTKPKMEYCCQLGSTRVLLYRIVLHVRNGLKPSENIVGGELYMTLWPLPLQSEVVSLSALSIFLMVGYQEELHSLLDIFSANTRLASHAQ